MAQVAGSAYVSTSGALKYRSYVESSGTVSRPALTAPLNALAMSAGNGSMMVQWDAPTTGVPAEYEVHIATSPTGTWVKANDQVVAARRSRLSYRVRNLRYGSTVYAKVRAVDGKGVAGPFSDIAHKGVTS